MPLRITIELIPRGDESRKRKLAQVEIENDGTAGDMRGGGDVGNYFVKASAEMQGGFDEFAAFTMGPLKRGNYIDTAIEVLTVMHSAKMPRRGYITGRVEVDCGHNDPSAGTGEQGQRLNGQ
jgi:hypothetical protein